MQGDAPAEGRKTQCAIAAVVETVDRVDLKRSDPDVGLLDGEDEGGEGTTRAYVALIHHGKGCQKAIQHRVNAKTTRTLGRTNPSRIDSAWRGVSGAVPQFVPRPHPRTDEVSQRVRRYASGVTSPAPLSWYAVLMITCDMYPLR